MKPTLRLIEDPLTEEEVEERPTLLEVAELWNACLLTKIPDYEVEAMRRFFPRFR